MESKSFKYLERNITIVCWMEFFNGLWFALPVYVLFLLDNGMNLSQAGLILGAASIMPFFFDIPSSVWADKYSRKLIIFISSVVFTLANVIFFFANSFELLFLASCLNGIGIALSTGIFGAFLYDTLLSLGKEKQYEKIRSRTMKSFFAGRFFASIAGAYAYYVNPRSVFLLSIFSGVICTALIVYLKEPPREKSISKSFRQVKEGLNFLLKSESVWNLVIVFSIMMATCDVLFNYYQPIMKLSGISVTNIGVAYAFINTFSFLGAVIYPRIRSKIDWKRLMAFYLAVDFFSSVFFSTQIVPLVYVSIIFLSISFGSFNIFLDNIIHKTVSSSHRATTVSICSQIYMLSYFILMAMIGFIVDHNSIMTGMLVNGLFVLVLIFAFLKINYKKELAEAA